MKRLVIFSYCCALSLALMAFSDVLNWWISDQENDFEWNAWVHFIWFFPAISQFIYTFRTSHLLGLSEYKSSDSLDDFAMNDMDLTDEIIENDFWMKGFAMINSLFLCFLFLSVFPNLLNMISRLVESSEWTVTLTIISSGFAMFLAIPTVVYNLRTFNISRVRKINT